MTARELALAIRRAEQLAGRRLDPAPLTDAAALLAEPWCVLLVGRVGAGKSTLANRLTGQRAATGLGGVTRTLARTEGLDGATIVDTPGIDDPDEAITRLSAEFASADHVLWVVDGLQPLTASERAVIDALLSPACLLSVVVSRADLIEPAELVDVVARARSMLATVRPERVVAVDLRRSADADDLGRPALPGPRRAAVIEAAVATLRAAQQAAVRPMTLALVLAQWRTEVRQLTASVDGEVGSGALRNRHDALDTLVARAAEATLALTAFVSPLPAPALPTPTTGVPTALASVVAGLGGAEGASRVLKAEAARWLAAGELYLSEDWPGREAIERTRVEQNRLQQALDAVQSLLLPHRGQIAR